MTNLEKGTLIHEQLSPTGRSLREPELQSLPPRTELGSELLQVMRKTFGERAVSVVDFSELELRALAAEERKR